MLLNNDTVFDEKLVAAKSSLPSPFKSPMATEAAPVPAVKSCLAVNETVPDDPVLRNTDIVLVPLFATAISSLPSPSTSPNDIPNAALPAVRSTLVAKKDPSIVPGDPIFRKMETVDELL